MVGSERGLERGCWEFGWLGGSDSNAAVVVVVVVTAVAVVEIGGGGDDWLWRGGVGRATQVRIQVSRPALIIEYM